MTMQIQEHSNAERILLAEELWDSVANDETLFPLTEEQKDVLNMRLAKYMLDKEAGASWSEVTNGLSENEQKGHLPFPRSGVGMPLVTLQRHATLERCWMGFHVGAWERCGNYFLRGERLLK